MKKIGYYLSLIKFSHSIFALPFAFIGFFLAVYRERIINNYSNYLPSYWASSDLQERLRGFYFYGNKFVLVLFCMIFARSAAMAFNRYLDRNIDAKNPRTKIREIPSGIIKPQNALFFTIAASLLFILCCYFINILCFYLSFVALFVVLGYSYTKRFTPLCHLVLGLGLSLAPIGAYIAITNHFDLLPILFSFVVLFWVSGFDIIYALQDAAFDKANGLKSIPVLLGLKNALLLSRIFHMLAAGLLLYIGLQFSFKFLYFIGTILFWLLLIRQHLIVKANDLSKINMAFFTLNGIASVVFALFVIMDLIFMD